MLLLIMWHRNGDNLALMGDQGFQWLGDLSIPRHATGIQVIGDVFAWIDWYGAWGTPLAADINDPLQHSNLLHQLLSPTLPSANDLDVGPMLHRHPGPALPRTCCCVGGLSLPGRTDPADPPPEPIIATNGPYAFSADKNGMFLVTTTATKRRWWWSCMHCSEPFRSTSHAADTLRTLFPARGAQRHCYASSGPLRPDVMAACPNKHTILIGYRDGRIARLDRQYAAPAGLGADAPNDEAEEVDYPIFRGWIGGSAGSSERDRDPVRHMFPWSVPGDQVERVLVVHTSGAGRLWETMTFPGASPAGDSLAHLRAEIVHPYILTPETVELQGVPLPVAGMYPLLAMVCLDGVVRVWKVDSSDLPLGSEPAKFAPLTDPELVPAPPPDPRAEPFAHPLHRPRSRSRSPSLADPAASRPQVLAAQPPRDQGRLNAAHFNPLDIEQLAWLPPAAAKHLIDECASTAQQCLVITTRTESYVAMVPQRCYGPCLSSKSALPSYE